MASQHAEHLTHSRPPRASHVGYCALTKEIIEWLAYRGKFRPMLQYNDFRIPAGNDPRPLLG